MRTGVIAKKLGMTRFFAEDGAHVPVTVLELDGCQVVGQRTKDRDGYVALTLGAGAKKAKNTNKAQRAVFAERCRAEIVARKRGAVGNQREIVVAGRDVQRCLASADRGLGLRRTQIIARNRDQRRVDRGVIALDGEGDGEDFVNINAGVVYRPICCRDALGGDHRSARRQDGEPVAQRLLLHGHRAELLLTALGLGALLVAATAVEDDGAVIILRLGLDGACGSTGRLEGHGSHSRAEEASDMPVLI